MTRKKRAVLWIGGILLAALVCCSFLSNRIYFALLPRVETYRFMSTVADDGEVQYWVPEECVFPNLNETSDAVVYRVYERRGPFAMEYFAQAIEVNLLVEDHQGKVRVSGPTLGHHENLIQSYTIPFTNGDAVDWLNPGTIF